MKDYKLLKLLKVIACATGALLLFSLGVMLLWNWLIPELFKGPTITIFQAIGILLLSKLLTFGFGGRCHCNDGQKEFWKRKFEEKMQRMSPEERAKFKGKFMGKWFDRCESYEGNSDKNE